MELTLAESTVNVIFNNGSGGTGNQTADLIVAVPAGETAVEAWITDTVSYTAPEGWVVPTPAEPTYTLVATAFTDIKATDKVLIVTTAGESSYVLLNNADKGPALAFNGTTWDETMLWNVVAVDGGYTIYVNGSTTNWLYGTATNNGLCVGNSTNGKVFNFAVPYEGQNAYLTYTDSDSAARYVGVYTTTPNFRGYKIDSYGKLTSNITGQSTTFYVVTEVTEG